MNKGYFYFQNVNLKEYFLKVHKLLLTLKIGSYWIVNSTLTSILIFTEKQITYLLVHFEIFVFRTGFIFSADSSIVYVLVLI